MRNIFKKSLFIVASCLMASVAWGADATFTMSDYFDGSNTTAEATSPVAATVSTNATKSNAQGGKLGSTGNYFQIILSTETFSAASINGYINGVNTSLNWAFQFSTDGGSTWSDEVTQANDGLKELHDISVDVTIPSGANGFRVIRRAGTGTYVSSITLTLGASGPSQDATLKSLSYKLGDEEPIGVEGFVATQLSYNVELPAETTDLPKVSAEKNDSKATVVITDVTEIPGKATVEVTAEDPDYTKTYEIHFTKAEPEKSHDARLNKISYTFNSENISLEGLPDKTDHVVELPVGTSASDISNFGYDPVDPKVSSKEDDFDQMKSLPYKVTITITAEDGETQMTYTVTFKEEEPSVPKVLTATWDNIVGTASIDQENLIITGQIKRGNYIKAVEPTFTGENIDYWTPDEPQDFTLSADGIDYEFSSPDGPIVVYTVIITEEPASDDATLKSLKVDGQPVPDFDPEETEYTVEYNCEIKKNPEVTAETNDPNAKEPQITQVEGGAPGKATVVVTAEDGITTKKYTVQINCKEVEKSHDATLNSLKYGNTSVPNFSANTLEYNVELPAGTTTAPTVSAEKNDSKAQDPDITQATSVPGTATVVVIAEDGTTKNTYKINFTAAAVVTAKYLPLGVKTFTENTTIYGKDITEAGDPKTSWVVVPNYGTGDKKYTNVNNDANGNPDKIKDNLETISSNTKMIQIKTDGNTYENQKRVIIMHVKGITAVVGHGTSGSSNCGMTIGCDEFSTELVKATEVASVVRKSNSGSFIVGKEGLDATKEYVIAFYAAGGDVYFHAVEFITSGGLPKESEDPEDPQDPETPTDPTVHTPGIYEEKTIAGGYGGTLTVSGEREYEVYYPGKTTDGDASICIRPETQKQDGITINSSTSTKAKDGWFEGTLASISNCSLSANAEFAAASSNVYHKMTNNQKYTFRIKGFDQFSFLGKDKKTDTSSKQDKPENNQIFEVYIDNVLQAAQTNTSSITLRRYDLPNTGQHTIEVRAINGGNSEFYAFSLRVAEEPRTKWVKGNDSTQVVLQTQSPKPVYYFTKYNSKGETKLEWSGAEATGITLTKAGSSGVGDTLVLGGVANCPVGEYHYRVVTYKGGVETSRANGKFKVISDIRALSDTIADAFQNEEMEEIIFKYYALDASAITLEWKDGNAPAGIDGQGGEDNTYVISGTTTAAPGEYHYTITIEGSETVITGYVEVFSQDLGENPVLYLYQTKTPARGYKKDQVYQYLKEDPKGPGVNLQPRPAIGKLRAKEQYDKFKWILISEDVNADNQEILEIIQGGANLPVLNMKGFTYAEGRLGWGEPDNGTKDTISQRAGTIYVQNDHPIFKHLGGKKTGDSIQILDGKALSANDINGVMPINIDSVPGSYCLATAYTRNIKDYYKDGRLQTVIHEIPASKSKRSGTYICFPISLESTKYLTSDGKNLLKGIVDYLLSGQEAEIKAPTLQINRFSVDGVDALIDQENNHIKLEIESTHFTNLDSLKNIKVEIVVEDPVMTHVIPSSVEDLDLQSTTFMPTSFVVTDYINRRVYDFSVRLLFNEEEGIDEVYTVGDWVNIFDMYGRKVTTTNENIYTMDLPQGIYIAVTANGQTIKMMR